MPMSVQLGLFVLLVHTSGRHAQIHGHIVVSGSVLFAVHLVTRVVRLIVHVLTVGNAGAARHVLLVRVLHVNRRVHVLSTYCRRHTANKAELRYAATALLAHNALVLLHEIVVTVSGHYDCLAVLALIKSQLSRELRVLRHFFRIGTTDTGQLSDTLSD